MKLQSLHLKNFRCFEDTIIDFHEKLTVLVGVNGSGKSNMLEVVSRFIFSLVAEKIYNYNENKMKSSLVTPIDIFTGNITAKMEFHLKNLSKEYIFSCKEVFDNFKNHSFQSEHDISDISFFDEKYGNIIFISYKDIRTADAAHINPSINSSLNDLNKIQLSSVVEKIDIDSACTWLWMKSAEQALERDSGRKDFSIPELQTVKNALEEALLGYKNPRFLGTPPRFVIYKESDNNPYEFSKLSAGYRTMLALIMDLARRMAVANADFYAKENANTKENKSVLESPAIVLIDEIELHLHPSWQQRVLPDLMRIFPNTQFIVTTHSPQVISSIPNEHIRLLEDGKVYSISEVTEGVDAARILQEVFGVNPLPQNSLWAEKLNRCNNLVYSDNWADVEVKPLLEELEAHYRKDYPPLYAMRLHLENLEWEREHEKRA